ncbi:MAG TPA: sensor domain-containing diguanylate cyclase [Candidatus Eisenbacteria bacterium]|nr:sensor domain-containing diguanylate cyclase [Candidatus Eisenbacteria bacterium]
MKQRNGAGSKRLVEATERFIRSEHKLLEVLASRRILKKKECDHFAKDLSLSAAKKRSSDVFGSAVAINRKVMAVLSKGKDSTGARSVSDADVLSELASLVERASAPEVLFTDALIEIGKAVPFQNATLFLMNRDSRQMEPAAVVGEVVDLVRHVRFERGSGFSSWVAQQRKPVLLNDLHREGGCEAASLRSFLSVPLIVQGDVVGVINLGHSKAGVFDEESARRVALYALPLAAAAMRSLMLRESERLGTTDELTSLYNRRHFDRSLEDEIGRARRYGHKLSVVVMKASVASSAGTSVLGDMGRALKQAARGTDCVARYSGDEFRILLPHTGASEAQIAAERLRSVVERHATSRRRGITVNVGVATFPADAGDSASLSTRAEAALLRRTETA